MLSAYNLYFLLSLYENVEKDMASIYRELILPDSYLKVLWKHTWSIVYSMP